MSWSLLYNVGRLALSKSSSYVSEWDPHMARLNARSCIRSPSFCLTTYKNVILGGEYVSLGKIKASYSNSLALDGFKYLKRHSIPTFG